MPKINRRSFFALIVWLFTVIINANDFTNTQVTIYNRDLGLVYQEKSFTLNKGFNTVQIEGVSRRVQAATVKLSFPYISGKYHILEQNYLFDLVSTTKIFSKYTSETITLRLESGETISGTLMKQEDKKVILSLPNEVVRVLNADNIVDYEFPALPGGLILKPTLEWNIFSDYKGKADAQLSYLTSGMSWNAEYILVLDNNEKEFTLNSWISLDNQSGTTFDNTKVKLIAGDINRVNRPKVAFMPAENAPKTRNIADYHLYELPELVTLRNSELKQVSLFNEISGKGVKQYQYENGAYVENEKPLQVFYSIENIKENNMGMALPRGVVRIFQKDTDESLQFIGEDRIDHTSNKDILKLKIGNAFDVKGKRTIAERDRSSKNFETMTIKIEITNRNTNAVDVEIIERLPRYWDIKKSSHDYIQQSSSQIVFSVTISADTVETIQYTFTHRL